MATHKAETLKAETSKAEAFKAEAFMAETFEGRKSILKMMVALSSGLYS